MFRLNILQNQWLLLALAGGVVLTLAVILAYLMFWQPRQRRDAAEPGARSEDGGISPFLIAVFVSILGFAVVYVVLRTRVPPNW
jgi:hypothetical protein